LATTSNARGDATGAAQLGSMVLLDAILINLEARAPAGYRLLRLASKVARAALGASGAYSLVLGVILLATFAIPHGFPGGVGEEAAYAHLIGYLSLGILAVAVAAIGLAIRPGKRRALILGILLIVLWILLFIFTGNLMFGLVDLVLGALVIVSSRRL